MIMGAFREIQEECLEANRALPHYKLVDLTFGNVSVVDRDQGVFAIKPSGIGYENLRREDIVVCGMECGKVLEGKLRPSSDAPTHRRLFLAFSKIRAVVHTHSRHAVAFAQAGREIPCLGTTHADYFNGTIPVTRFLTEKEIATNYEWETGNVVVERFIGLDPAQITAVLIRGHGPFVWGKSGPEAVEAAVALEIVAEMAMKTMQLISDACPLPEKLSAKHFTRKHGCSAYYGQLRRSGAEEG